MEVEGIDNRSDNRVMIEVTIKVTEVTEGPRQIFQAQFSPTKPA